MAAEGRGGPDVSVWKKTLMRCLEKAGWLYSISIRLQKPVIAAIQAIPEPDGQTLTDYPEEGEAQITETTLSGKRMIVRRTRLLGAQAELWPDWRYFPF